MLRARREAAERRAEAQGLAGVAERNAALTADLAAAREQALQLREHAEALEGALEERDANAEAEQLLRARVIFQCPPLKYYACNPCTVLISFKGRVRSGNYAYAKRQGIGSAISVDSSAWPKR